MGVMKKTMKQHIVEVCEKRNIYKKNSGTIFSFLTNDLINTIMVKAVNTSIIEKKFKLKKIFNCNGSFNRDICGRRNMYSYEELQEPWEINKGFIDTEDETTDEEYVKEEDSQGYNTIQVIQKYLGGNMGGCYTMRLFVPETINHIIYQVWCYTLFEDFEDSSYETFKRTLGDVFEVFIQTPRGEATLEELINHYRKVGIPDFMVLVKDWYSGELIIYENQQFIKYCNYYYEVGYNPINYYKGNKKGKTCPFFCKLCFEEIKSPQR
tara:strand:+ start:159 stop:956 length:798 start_codon:yes stop_codon:yes gene_type:complete